MHQCNLGYHGIASRGGPVIIAISISLTLEVSSLMTSQMSALPFDIRVMFDLKYDLSGIGGDRVSDPFGNTLICRESDRNGDPYIYRMSTIQKNQWSEATQAAKDGANARQPDMAVNQNDTIYISWTLFSNERTLIK